MRTGEMNLERERAASVLRVCLLGWLVVGAIYLVFSGSSGYRGHPRSRLEFYDVRRSGSGFVATADWKELESFAEPEVVASVCIRRVESAWGAPFVSGRVRGLQMEFLSNTTTPDEEREVRAAVVEAVGREETRFLANDLAQLAFDDFADREVFVAGAIGNVVFWSCVVGGAAWFIGLTGWSFVRMLQMDHLIDRSSDQWRRGVCQRCGYDLAGLGSRACPECGFVVERPEPNEERCESGRPRD